jgi:hypothetical protein
MPIYPLMRDPAFDPDHVGAMGAAFEQALAALGLTDRSDPLCEVVAKKVIELGKQGERDPDRLRDLTIRSLTAWTANP